MLLRTITGVQICYWTHAAAAKTRATAVGGVLEGHMPCAGSVLTQFPDCEVAGTNSRSKPIPRELTVVS